MKCVELNPKGNFDPWESSKVQELKEQQVSKSLGQKLLFENENMLVWEVVLFPQERLPFRKQSTNYCWVSHTNGLVISRRGDGKINMIHLKKGDSQFFKAEDTNYISDLENIGENLIFINIMEFKPLIKKTETISKAR
ncbi:hypothetical protein [Spongiimicrobium sp. 3-5]|uniref:hypothetical protein n=1 Tax=Spongiimicrobium sp. 3-5 TaxID=3332596 RepID=UPI0039800FEC